MAPLTNTSMPSVATKGGTLRLVTNSPLPTPISAPSPSANSTAGAIPPSCPPLTWAMTTDVSTSTPVTDRSSPATSMTSVCPMATSPNCDACRRIRKNRLRL